MPVRPSPRNQEPEPALHLLSGKNVLVTGAGKNIGRSIALEMAIQGANIFFTEIDKERCTNLEQELNGYQVRSRGFFSDISKTKDIDSLCDLLAENEIKIDVLINNVGIFDKMVHINDLDVEQSHKTFNTNVVGPLYLTKRISQMMKSQNIQGSIIFITSIHQWTIGCWPIYSSSKAALGMAVKELAVDLSPFGIRVNGIAPGWVKEDERGNPVYHKYTLLHNSSINPRYIGRAAVYLTSDFFSRFTTGTIIKIDAGLSLYSYRLHELPQ